MTINEEDAKAFARFWDKEHRTTQEKTIQQVTSLMEKVMSDLPRDDEGRIKDDYFRGTEDCLKSFVEGFLQASKDSVATFDDTFDYRWYRYLKQVRK